MNTVNTKIQIPGYVYGIPLIYLYSNNLCYSVKLVLSTFILLLLASYLT